MRHMVLKLIFSIFAGLIIPVLLIGGLFFWWPEEKQKIQKNTAYDNPVIFVIENENSVRQMDLDQYLFGVLLAEMPADFETEALKAQAVVARTFALKTANAGIKHLAGAVCTDYTCCQGYISPNTYMKKTGAVDQLIRFQSAVEATSGQALYYDGEWIEATYFSCSGGYTEDAQEVWGVSYPYLHAQESPGEENAAYYSWDMEISNGKLCNNLGIVPENKGVTFSDWKYTEGGGTESVLICGKRFTGMKLRQLLGLRSTSFTVDVLENSVVFHTRGYGHRVGMSQYGAEAMAAAGKDYRAILAYYYPGTVIETIQKVQ